MTDAALERRGKQVSKGSGAGGASKIEAEILKLEERQRELEHLMAHAFSSGSQRDGKKHASDLEKIRSRIEELYGRWGAL